MINLYYLKNKVTKHIFNIVLLLCLILLINSCDKKKHIITKKTNNTAAIYQLVKKGDSFKNSSKNDSAIFYYNKALPLCNPIKKYADQYVYISHKLGEIFTGAGDYYGSETIVSKALPYLKYTSRPRFSQLIYKVTADNYYGLYDYDNALLYHKKALKTAISQFRKAQIKCEIGFMYLQQKKYLEAIDILEPLAQKKTEDKTDSLNTEYQHASVLYNLGLCYLRLGNHKVKALENLTESLEINSTANDPSFLIGNYHALYLFYKKYDNAELKKLYATKGYIAAYKANSQAMQINALREVIEAEDSKNLKKYIDLYIKLTDSTFASQRLVKNQFATTAYDSQQDKNENLYLKTQKAENELQLERQKNRSYISYTIIFVSIITLIFTVFYLTTKGKREKRNTIFKNEMRISEKLQFELEKDIDKVLSFSENHNLEKEVNKEEFLSYLNNIYSKTRNISRENSEIAVDENFEKGLKEMISGYTSSELNIIVNGLYTLSWSKIDRVKKITVFRVIQEIFDQTKILNSATLASVTFKKEEKHILITYADNNKEIQEYNTALNKKFENIVNRLKSVKGFFQISQNTNQGFKIFIKLPI